MQALPFFSQSVRRCYRAILRARRPPPTSKAPSNPTIGRAPPVAGRVFAPEPLAAAVPLAFTVPLPLPLPKPSPLSLPEPSLSEPSSSQKETLVEKVLSSAVTVPKSSITRYSGPSGPVTVGGPCTIRTGKLTGSVPGGVGPGANLGTVLLPV